MLFFYFFFLSETIVLVIKIVGLSVVSTKGNDTINKTNKMFEYSGKNLLRRFNIFFVKRQDFYEEKNKIYYELIFLCKFNILIIICFL